jgi:acetylglutamate kinase
MEELVTKLTEEVGITKEQAQKSIETIASFVKEKFPMLGGAVDNILLMEIFTESGAGTMIL